MSRRRGKSGISATSPLPPFPKFPGKQADTVTIPTPGKATKKVAKKFSVGTPTIKLKKGKR